MDAQPATLAASGRPDPQRSAPPGPAPGRPPSMLRRVAPVAGLFLLAPLVGEYLLGNVSTVELPALPVLALLYGSGAILVRELARRTGRGWPTMLGLGLVYGLLEAGPIDQTLFNSPGPADAGARAALWRPNRRSSSRAGRRRRPPPSRATRRRNRRPLWWRRMSTRGWA